MPGDVLNGNSLKMMATKSQAEPARLMIAIEAAGGIDVQIRHRHRRRPRFFNARAWFSLAPGTHASLTLAEQTALTTKSPDNINQVLHPPARRYWHIYRS